MGNLNCKTCQCNRQLEEQSEFIQPETIFNIMQDGDIDTPSEDRKQKLLYEAKNYLRGNINFIYNYKSEPNWDNAFNPEDNKLATINGLLNLKKKINEIYDNFLNFEGIPEQVTYDKDNIEGITEPAEFINRFKPVILRNILSYFKINGLEKKLKHSNIILTNDENMDIYNQLFRLSHRDSFLSQGTFRKIIPEPKKSFDIRPLEVIYENLKADPKKERRASVFTTKANTKDSSHSKGNILSSVTDFIKNLTVSRKNSLHDGVPVVDEDLKPIEVSKGVNHEKRGSYSSSFKKSGVETEGGKKINRVLIRGKDTYEMNKIYDIYQMEEDNLIFVSFKNKENNSFYEGYWHIIKHCKYGLGVEYHFDSNNRYKYFGYFKDDKYHGLGILLKENNYSYYGEFRNGKFAGYGMEKGKVSSYQGFFSDDKYCGYGEYTYMKSSYVGCYGGGQKEVMGFAKFDDGCLYIGTYQNNLMHGVGLYKWPEGHLYYGEWKEDKKNGIGYHSWDSGHSYIGGYKNDFKDGNGEYSFGNGAKLRGTWIMGKKENIFELTDKFKTSYQIAYRNDIQVD
jgi:hypothetical protein